MHSQFFAPVNTRVHGRALSLSYHAMIVLSMMSSITVPVQLQQITDISVFHCTKHLLGLVCETFLFSASVTRFILILKFKKMRFS